MYFNFVRLDFELAVHANIRFVQEEHSPAQEPAVFRKEFFDTLLHYNEELLSMAGAGGRPKPKSFKRTMKSESLCAAVAQAAGGVEPGEAARAPAAEATAAESSRPAGAGGGGACCRCSRC